MSRFDTNERGADKRGHASVSEILACFRDERPLLFRLALLIAGDEAAAEQSVVNACESTVQGHSPFRDWLTEWAKTATMTSAISKSSVAIRRCEPAYRDLGCTHSEHWSPGNEAERERSLSVVLGTDPRTVIAELDPLARAVLVLRLAAQSSMQDCVLRLNVSRPAVLAANCRAMTWLHRRRLQQFPGRSVSVAKKESQQGG